MKIELKQIPVREVFNGYVNSAEEGVVGYGGRLNIRPAFQREFIYSPQQSAEVIRSLRKGFPLNVMYWVKNNAGDYELLDGQQRTLSICEFASGNLRVDGQLMDNLTEAEQAQLLEYPLMIYFCEGSERDVLDWFRIINIAGEKLTPQELLNAVHTGPWLTNAKEFFSKTGCAAYGLAADYMKGSPIRQEYLETALRWINNGDVAEYMSEHQHEQNANALKQYFRAVFAWVEDTFPPAQEYPKEMKGVEWGPLYNVYGQAAVDTRALAAKIAALMSDDDVTRRSGIFAYVLSGEEKHLNLRKFSDKHKRAAYQRQGGVCVRCRGEFKIKDMEGDHITPWSKGGATTPENCQMLCKDCNRRKSNQ